jgi:hypothetical protein
MQNQKVSGSSKDVRSGKMVKDKGKDKDKGRGRRTDLYLMVDRLRVRQLLLIHTLRIRAIRCIVEVEHDATKMLSAKRQY